MPRGVAGGKAMTSDTVRLLTPGRNEMSLPAVSRHLRVLEQAGMIVRTRVGREHRIRVNPQPIQGAQDWIALYADVWQHQFDALDDVLKQLPGTGTDGDPA